MKLPKLVFLLPVLCFLGQITFSGCAKEYSYEGSPPPDTAAVPLPGPDTLDHRVIAFPDCMLCDPAAPAAEMTWSFRNEGAYVCGTVTRAVIAPDRIAFTFWGTSACSQDSGLIVTVMMASPLDMDKSNTAAQKVSVLYYDNITPSDVFIALSNSGFNLVIEHYDHANATASGTFSGFVDTEDGRRTKVEEGRFRFRFN